MRNLASVQVVSHVADIPGKDSIGLASFRDVGFKVIVNKKETFAGSRGVYFEVDSLLPPTPEFEFLRSRCWSETFQGHKIRAMKMGGVFSEGLFLPLSAVGLVNASDGQDVSDLLKVKKYDPESLEEAKNTPPRKQPSKLMGFFMGFALFRFLYNLVLRFNKPRDRWPKFIRKTDETRAQKITQLFNELKGKAVYVTEKCEGQSATYALRNNRFYVCSRNFELHEKNNKYWEVAIRYDMEKKLRAAKKFYGFDIGIQCENCGPGIQGNIYQLADTTPFVFNVINLKTGVRFTFDEMERFCIMYSLRTVPVVRYASPFAWETIDELTSYADGKSQINPKAQREGVVIRTEDPLSPLNSFKVVSPVYMLKGGHNAKET